MRDAETVGPRRIDGDPDDDGGEEREEEPMRKSVVNEEGCREEMDAERFLIEIT